MFTTGNRWWRGQSTSTTVGFLFFVLGTFCSRARENDEKCGDAFFLHAFKRNLDRCLLVALSVIRGCITVPINNTKDAPRYPLVRTYGVELLLTLPDAGVSR